MYVLLIFEVMIEMKVFGFGISGRLTESLVF